MSRPHTTKLTLDATVVLSAANIYGPFVSLPEEHQRLALQLVYYFDSLPAKLLKALTACCTSRLALPL
jgi:hypothetical protein